MTVIQRLNHRISLLENQVQEKESKISEMEADIKTAIVCISDTFDGLGINFKDKSMDKMGVGSIVMKLAPKLISGKANFNRLEELAPFAEKYDHLISK